MMRLFRGSNSAGRRKYRRAIQRIWDNAPAAFQPGELVKITVPHYGVRYEDTKATVVGKGMGYGTYVVQSPRRKSPLVIQAGHLVKVA
jgi:hypothetical protein